MARLIVKEPGTLLSKLIDREITLDQLETIRIVLEDDVMAFNVREDVRITNLMRDEYEEFMSNFNSART